jgi:hypothetical protein
LEGVKMVCVLETACWRLVRRDGCSHSLQWGNAIGEPYTGNPYVQFDEGTEVERPPPTLHRDFVEVLINNFSFNPESNQFLGVVRQALLD